MARSSGYTYDPKTGKWTKSTTSSNDNKKSDNGDNLTSNSSDKNDSTGDVEKTYNTIEINTLNGTLSFIVTEETIKLKAGDTVKLNGLGKYLSGDYYVKDITRQISSSGYSHSATLIKTDFGKSLKVSSSKKSTKKETNKVNSSTKADSAKRTYTVKKGDCLWNIAKKYYGDGRKYTKIYDANTSKIANPNLIYVGQKLVIP